MIYVCDTHAFVWGQMGKPFRLGRAAQRIVRRAERGLDELHLSVVSLFEIAQLVEKGRLRTSLGWDDWLAAAQTTPGLVIEPLSVGCIEHGGRIRGLRNPFDRLVVATAIHLDAALISVDQEIRESGVVQVVWD